MRYLFLFDLVATIVVAVAVSQLLVATLDWHPVLETVVAISTGWFFGSLVSFMHTND